MKPSKMLTSLLLAVSSSAFAAPTVIAVTDLPDICKSAAYYTTVTLFIPYSDGEVIDPYNPKGIKIVQDFKKYPISKVTDLGNCTDSPSNLKASWCHFAGGEPEVYDVEVSYVDPSGQNEGAVADVIVQYNRGGCNVVELTTP